MILKRPSAPGKPPGHYLTVAGRAYDLDAFRRVSLIGAGKATALMAKALEELLADRLTQGLILVKPGYATPCAPRGSLRPGTLSPTRPVWRGPPRLSAAWRPHPSKT